MREPNGWAKRHENVAVVDCGEGLPKRDELSAVSEWADDDGRV